MIKESTINRFDELELGKKYEEGMTTTEICKEYNTSWNQLHQYFILRNIKTRKATRRKSLRPKAPIGQKFGLWTVVSEEVKSGKELDSPNTSRNLYWLVQCECGELAWKSSEHLKRGTSTRCKKCGNKIYISDEGEVITNAIIQHKYTQTKNALPNRIHRSRKLKLTFNISIEYLNELYEKQNHKCALSGLSLEPNLSLPMNEQFMSIDRIDSNKGYEKDNIQWVDKRINMMKGSLSNEEFIYLCNEVSKYSKCE